MYQISIDCIQVLRISNSDIPVTQKKDVASHTLKLKYKVKYKVKLKMSNQKSKLTFSNELK